MPCTVALLLLCLSPAHAQVVSPACKPDRCTASWSCVDCCSCGCWLHAVNLCIVLMRAPDACLHILQPALGGGQQPVNDQLATGAPVSQQAVQPANQLGTQKPAVTVQNVPAAVAANRLGFTDRDTLPPVSIHCHKDDHLSKVCVFVTAHHIIPAPGHPPQLHAFWHAACNAENSLVMRRGTVLRCCFLRNHAHPATHANAERRVCSVQL